MNERLGALAAAFSAELQRRIGWAFVLALGAGMLAVFSLGASILPDAFSTNLLLAYALFLGTFAVALGLLLLRALGGRFGDALAVASWARRDAEDRRRAIGAGRIPRNPAEARQWLISHADPNTFQAQRVSAHILAGDLDAARAALATHPTATAIERFEVLDDGWYLDFLGGEMPSLAPLEAARTELRDERERTYAAVVIATLKAHAAAATAGDWVAPLAAERATLDDHAAGFVARYVVIHWAFLMAVASALVGVALVVGRVTGVWTDA